MNTPLRRFASSPLSGAPLALGGGTHPLGRRSRTLGCSGSMHFAPDVVLGGRFFLPCGLRSSSDGLLRVNAMALRQRAASAVSSVSGRLM